MDYAKKSLELHKEYKGKLAVASKVPLRDKDDLSIAYTPGVARPCQEIAENPSSVYDYTIKGNTVLVVSDGTAVLGLGDIGPHAAIPVMEGKSILFKEFAGVDAFPLCLDTKDPDEIIEIVAKVSPVFGGINLEDISAPRCFYIEEKLKERLDIPVFHDDQHGTAIVVLASMINALKLMKKSFSEVRVVINGAGSAGMAIANLLLDMGVKDMAICDRRGSIWPGDETNNKYQDELAKIINPNGFKGTLEDVLKGADVFIGVSAAGALKAEWISNMNSDPVVFAMANPVPEIMPDEAMAAGVKIMGTGRSDFPNQINNVLAFPGIFKGALEARAKAITQGMKIAAAEAIASLVGDELSKDYIIPKPFDKRVVDVVCESVKRVALEESK